MHGPHRHILFSPKASRYDSRVFANALRDVILGQSTITEGRLQRPKETLL